MSLLDRYIYAVLDHARAVVVSFLLVTALALCLVPFGKTNFDMASYLPPSAPSTEAVRIMSEDFTQDLPNANAMVRNVTIADALSIKQHLAEMHGVSSVIWLDDYLDVKQPLALADQDSLDLYYHPNEDGTGTALFMLSLEKGNEESDVGAIRNFLDSLGQGNAISGDAADIAQMQSSVVEQVALAAAIVGPIIILLLVLSTTSWIEPILFLAAIALSILINIGTNTLLGEVSFITYSVSPILQLAVSLDYAIFLLHEFAAQRKKIPDVHEAMAQAMRVSMATIAASAITTLFGFLSLSFMQFQIGADLGLNLVKGIVLSFVTVVSFLPALTMLLYGLIDRTRHRPFMPSFKNVGSVMAKARVPMLVLVLVLIVPCFLGQRHTEFTYDNGQPDVTLRTGADAETITEEFGYQNALAVLVPRGDVAREALLADELEKLPGAISVMSLAKSVGPAIPQGFLPDSVLEQFCTDDWSRIICYVDTEVEGEVAFNVVEQANEVVTSYYDEYYMAGQSANLYDMKQVVAVDNVVVSLVAIIAIFLVVLITFRSLSLPLALLLTIESGIWINLSIPYFQGTPINFIGYLVVNTVALGATIDYGILLTTHYLAHRKNMPARKAIHLALGEAFPSLLVSAGTLASAGMALSLSSKIAAVSTLGFLLARGALMSLILVSCLLPALLVFCDRFIRATTFKAGFFSEKDSATAQPADGIAPQPSREKG